MASVEKIAIPNKRFIGDVVNGLVIVNTLVYIGFIVSHAFLQSSMMLNILTPCSGQLKHPLTQYPSIFECQLDFLIQP